VVLGVRAQAPGRLAARDRAVLDRLRQVPDVVRPGVGPGLVTQPIVCSLVCSLVRRVVCRLVPRIV
jgi:hypothetical protein